MEPAYAHMMLCRICGDTAESFGPLPPGVVPGSFDVIETVCPHCPDDGLEDRAITFDDATDGT